MKRISPALLVAVASGAGAAAFAGTVTAEKASGPVLLTEQQMEQIVAAGPAYAWGRDNKVFSGDLTSIPGEGDGTYENSVPYRDSARPSENSNPTRSQSGQGNAYFA